MPESSGSLFQAASAHRNMVDFSPDTDKAFNCLNLSLFTLLLRSIGSKCGPVLSEIPNRPRNLSQDRKGSHDQDHVDTYSVSK